MQGNTEVDATLGSSPDILVASAPPGMPESSAASAASPTNDVDGVFRPGWEVSQLLRSLRR